MLAVRVADTAQAQEKHDTMHAPAYQFLPRETTGPGTRRTGRGAAGECGNMQTAGGKNAGMQDAAEDRAGISLDISQAVQEMYQRQADQARESGEKSQEAFDDLGRLMEIARRIARGDKVPLRDEKKLMEYSSDLYQMAKAAAMINAGKKHKKYKSLYEDEDKQSLEEKIREMNREDAERERSLSFNESAEPAADAAEAEA